MARPLLPEYGPQNSSAEDIFTEQCILNGLILAGVAYGILFTIFYQCIFVILERTKRRPAKWLLVYTIAMFVLATTGFGANTKFIQLTFIDYRNYPGGPNAFTVEEYNHWVNMLAFVSYVLMSWLADGLVLHRFMTIYDFNLMLLPLPAFMYLGMIAMSLCLTVSMTGKGDVFWSHSAINFALAYWSLSIALNVSLTILISGRLFILRRRTNQALGNSAHSKPYISLLSMLVESAALYSLWVVVFIILYARHSPAQHIIFPPLGQVQGIAPLLIIFRVGQGKAWSREAGTATWSAAVSTNIVIHGGRGGAGGTMGTMDVDVMDDRSYDGTQTINEADAPVPLTQLSSSSRKVNFRLDKKAALVREQDSDEYGPASGRWEKKESRMQVERVVEVGR
ncbi:hypothetical protein FA15DRAFT_756680 [Coprinopsis marcescibilis]|uniref:Uncharacterized protein n=1 Tax=Coprinopsis marcescibilis TaxID=230819 RepID=A0A5C3KVI8_COPMA|nr:hypothetical protein FA15DRAFT_756680 [Coprinopsis marcescibilis]